MLVFAIIPAHASSNSAKIQRHLLVIGSNNGGNDRVTLRYAGNDAQNFSRIFTEMGGVSQSNVIALREPSILELQEAIAALDTRLRASDPSVRKEVVIYYSGHADEKGLLLGGASLTWKDLRKSIDALPAQVKITVLDACGSGAITRLKGGQRQPAFLVDASSDMKGYAFLTSSSDNEVAQESDRIGGSFFTQALITGMRGAADLNGDGRVTLSEAYQFAFNETLNRTQQTSGGAQHPSRDMKLSGTGDVVMTDLRETSAGLILNKDLDGHFFVRDQNRNLIAELYKTSGRPLELGLAAGTYSVLMEAKGVYAAENISIHNKDRRELMRTDFVWKKEEQTVARGDCNHCQADTSWRAHAHDMAFQTFFHPIMYRLDSAAKGMQFSLFFNNARAGLDGEQIALLGANMAQQGIDGFQIALFLNQSDRAQNGMQISAGINLADSIRGGQISPINISHWIDGIQAGYINISNNGAKGVQTGFINLDLGKLQGVQGGFFNLATDSVNGVQGGFLNIGTAPFTGVQGGFINIAGRGRVTQVGFVNIAPATVVQGGFVNVSSETRVQFGFVNVAKASHVQVGFVNIADDCNVPIGFFSFSRQGIYGVRATMDETGWQHTSVFSGTPWFFTDFDFGENNFSKRLISGGFAIGTRFGMQGPLWVSLEHQFNYIQTRKGSALDIDWYTLSKDSIAMSDTIANMKYNTMIRTKLDLGYNITSWIGISAGISANFLNTEGHANIQNSIPSWHGDVANNGHIKYWTGYQASITIGRLGKGFF